MKKKMFNLPVAVVEGEVSDFRELLVGFVDERPVHFANWDAAAAVVRRQLHRVVSTITEGDGGDTETKPSV